jgi:1-acylglycerone phosphate reductase
MGFNSGPWDVSVPAAQSLFHLNVWSYISASQAFLPLLRASVGAGKDHQSTIVNHTSVVVVVVVAVAPNAYLGVYHASKAASAMLSDTLRLVPQLVGIRVVEIKTGGVEWNFFNNV